MKKINVFEAENRLREFVQSTLGFGLGPADFYLVSNDGSSILPVDSNSEEMIPAETDILKESGLLFKILFDEKCEKIGEIRIII